MTGYPGFNFNAFAQAAMKLRSIGYVVEDPGEFGIADNWTWFDYMRKDLAVVLGSDGIATLDNWECSRGAQLEVYIAHQLHMPVMPVQVWLEKANEVSCSPGLRTDAT
jgi:uncharacterized protein DUF4406